MKSRHRCFGTFAVSTTIFAQSFPIPVATFLTLHGHVTCTHQVKDFQAYTNKKFKKHGAEPVCAMVVRAYLRATVANSTLSSQTSVN